MPVSQWIVILVALGTWLAFARVMKSYFRFANQRTPAKTALILCGFTCTAIQIATIGLTQAPSLFWLWAGLAVYALAHGLFWWALAAHGKAHPAFAFIRVEPSSLTTAGPYRLVRHPIYTAYLLAWCAGAVVAAQPWLFLAVAFMSLFYFTAARQEEQSFLAGTLAVPYREYRQRTGMFFPKLTGLFAGSPARVAEHL